MKVNYHLQHLFSNLDTVPMVYWKTPEHWELSVKQKPRLNDSQAWWCFSMYTADLSGEVPQSVISSCSSLCAPPVPRCLAQGGWRGSQHWWSHGSPLCWPPSYGSLEKTETKKIGNQHRHKSKWGCECSFWAPLPVRISLKAASTLVEPNADVSMNIRPFFSESHRGLKNKKTLIQSKMYLAVKTPFMRIFAKHRNKISLIY